MGQQSILNKIDNLVLHIKTTNERFAEQDVVYLLIEVYKIKERDSDRKKVENDLPHLCFFRDWVVHTRIDNKKWIQRKNELNDPARLITEILSIIISTETKDSIECMRESLIESLKKIVEDQDIG